jgi:hypothetical protein
MRMGIDCASKNVLATQVRNSSRVNPNFRREEGGATHNQKVAEFGPRVQGTFAHDHYKCVSRIEFKYKPVLAARPT